MKTVTIPSNESLWTASINGRKYAYPGGTVQEVPDEVAALLSSRAPSAKIKVDQPWTPHKVDGYVSDEASKDYAKRPM